ncbi:MAG: ribosome biogenesis GTP-binding protein YihA/YsxC [Bacteroidales bacterium]|nr:ribosome biogenesis GTP-binding protein YihA/YsxC [Bacteroidales bacterium]MCI5481935.1 ribosome biogenesis GTP-binding protein YihA/YsxC [Bacteroidales bacterium]MDD6750678.1 ribosome biogenesis GTP-binding protein YihA/YsxC [Bacteroidales bacterium]MDY2877892.1 ribosome biogenesis GTP-binding protein YihA/YsxC [Candidatus Cryptobacteroides sp.]
MKISEAKFAGSSARVQGKPKRRLPEFAFIGRSNVGKSSLINMLCKNSKLAMTSQTPGKTKVVNHFLVNDSWYLVDLPGYGFAKLGQKARDEIQAVVRDYVFNSEELVLLFVLIDSRHDLGAADLDFITDLGENGIPFSIIYTKCDKQGPNVLKAQIERNEARLLQEWEELPFSLCSSSQTGAGREEILAYIEQILNRIDQ